MDLDGDVPGLVPGWHKAAIVQVVFDETFRQPRYAPSAIVTRSFARWDEKAVFRFGFNADEPRTADLIRPIPDSGVYMRLATGRLAWGSGRKGLRPGGACRRRHGAIDRPFTTVGSLPTDDDGTAENGSGPGP